MARVGLVAPIFQFWDRPSGQLVAEFDHAVLKNDTRHPFVVQCEQFKTAKLLLERLRALANVEVLFGHEVVDVSQTDDDVSVDVRGPAGVTRHTGAWLIGADGGRSVVRKQCGIAFEGFTWPERFIVFTTPYDFEKNRGYCPRSYFADPGSWCNCFKVSADGPPGLWRTVFPTDPHQPEADLTSDARRAGADAEILPLAGALRGRAPQSLRHAPARGGDLPQGPRAARRRRRPCQQSDRRHGPQRRHPGRGQSVREARAASCSTARRSGCSISTTCSAARSRSSSCRSSRSPTRSGWRQAIPRCASATSTSCAQIAADQERSRQFLLRTAMIESQRRAASLELAETCEHARSGPSTTPRMRPFLAQTARFRIGRRHARATSWKPASPSSRPGSRRSAPLSTLQHRCARARPPIARPRAGAPASRCRRSTACRSASRTSSRRPTCRPRWARRCSPAGARRRTPRASSALRARRRRHPRQDRHHRVRRLRSARHPQSLEPRPHAGRLEQRLGRRRRLRHDQRRARHAGDRLDHPARELLRRVRLQADGRRAQPRKAATTTRARAAPACWRPRWRTPGRSPTRSRSASAATPARRVSSARTGRPRRSSRGGLPSSRPPAGRSRATPPRLACRARWQRLGAAGVEIRTRDDDEDVAAVESELADAFALSNRINSLGNALVHRRLRRARREQALARSILERHAQSESA